MDVKTRDDWRHHHATKIAPYRRLRRLSLPLFALSFLSFIAGGAAMLDFIPIAFGYFVGLSFLSAAGAGATIVIAHFRMDLKPVPAVTAHIAGAVAKTLDDNDIAALTGLFRKSHYFKSDHKIEWPESTEKNALSFGDWMRPSGENGDSRFATGFIAISAQRGADKLIIADNKPSKKFLKHMNKKVISALEQEEITIDDPNQIVIGLRQEKSLTWFIGATDQQKNHLIQNRDHIDYPTWLANAYTEARTMLPRLIKPM